jgi:hypothetical protein
MALGEGILVPREKIGGRHASLLFCKYLGPGEGFTMEFEDGEAVASRN